ncbi:unnamed protein product [Adineta ricciae]|uniref:Uncharacterized protein n=1 Tax=Adineta ricciae TaxID=249248 RepID=A0A815U514_ADIRI|nr:unnamed protein product [Adineta ricciae]
MLTSSSWMWIALFCLCLAVQIDSKSKPSASGVALLETPSSKAAGSHCVDRLQNQDESDIDCGGETCPKCENGSACDGDRDCLTNTCRKKKCVPFESCADNIKNQDETDIDCGGLKCPACTDLKMCKEHRDCNSALCERKRCSIVESCEDHVKNQDESDVDCGGVKCPRCALGRRCKAECDCISDSCKNKTCVVAESCLDGIKNQEETDIDCGGDRCAKCEDLKKCNNDCDCISGLCENNQCASSFQGNETSAESSTVTTVDSVSTTSTNWTTILSRESTTTATWMTTSINTSIISTNGTDTPLNRTSASRTTTTTTTPSAVLLNGTCISKSIVWKGYTWCLRDDVNSGSGYYPSLSFEFKYSNGYSYIGSNEYKTDNVWIDHKGLLHLRIINTSDIWSSAALYTTDRFTFGTFQWQIEGSLNALDPKVVLSLYTSISLTVDTMRTNEVNIEFARWGLNPLMSPNLFYNIWPAKNNESKTGSSFFYNNKNIYTTQRFIWSSESVAFKSISGFRNDDADTVQSWQSSSDFSIAVPQESAPVHMNLRIFHSSNSDCFPSDGKPVEVIIHDFIYHPPKPSAGLMLTYKMLLIILLTMFSVFCTSTMQNS